MRKVGFGLAGYGGAQDDVLGGIDRSRHEHEFPKRAFFKNKNLYLFRRGFPIALAQ